MPASPLPATGKCHFCGGDVSGAKRYCCDAHRTAASRQRRGGEPKRVRMTEHKLSWTKIMENIERIGKRNDESPRLNTGDPIRDIHHYGRIHATRMA